jgi:hypothetical protein
VIDISIIILLAFGADTGVDVSVKRVASRQCRIKVPERLAMAAEILKNKQEFRYKNVLRPRPETGFLSDNNTDENSNYIAQCKEKGLYCHCVHADSTHLGPL